MTKQARKIPETPGVRHRTPIVLNNTDGPRFVGYGGVSDGTGAKNAVVDLKRMKFAPGFNAPKPLEAFTIVREIHGYKGWVEREEFTEIESVEEISTIGGAIDSVLEQSSSRASMEWWLEQETRSAVRDKLVAKIREMTRRRVPIETED